MAREIVILWAGRHRRDRWDDLCADYRDRISRFVSLRELPVKVRDRQDEHVRLREEGRALLAAVAPPVRRVALDRRGKPVSSKAFARWLERQQEEWPHPLCFVVGSDLGLDREVTEAADMVMSLGPMTLPHELARLVLYEQVYRAFTIKAGIRYHREPL